jgi:hypothetical protein
MQSSQHLLLQNMKVVVLEDLAAHFKLKTQNVIDRIQDLQAEGLLTGMYTFMITSHQLRFLLSM